MWNHIFDEYSHYEFKIFLRHIYSENCDSEMPTEGEVEFVWNVMAHAQKPDLVFRRNGWVHLNRRGRQFSLLLAAAVWASGVVMLGKLSSLVVWSGVKGTGYPLHSPVSPSLPLPCVTVCHHVSTGLYLIVITLGTAYPIITLKPGNTRSSCLHFLTTRFTTDRHLALSQTGLIF
jgi:hypothetical protein